MKENNMMLNDNETCCIYFIDFGFYVFLQVIIILVVGLLVV